MKPKDIEIRVAIHAPLRPQENLLASATVEILFGDGITIQICDCRYISTKDGQILFSVPTFRHAAHGEFTREPTIRFPKEVDEMILNEANREWFKWALTM